MTKELPSTQDFVYTAAVSYQTRTAGRQLTQQTGPLY